MCHIVESVLFEQMIHNACRLVIEQDAPKEFAVIPLKNSFQVVVVLKNELNKPITLGRPIPLKLTLLYQDCVEVSNQHILKCLSRLSLGTDGRATLNLRINENSNNRDMFVKGKTKICHDNRSFVIRISILNPTDMDICPVLNPTDMDICPVDTFPIYVWARDKGTRKNHRPLLVSPPPDDGSATSDAPKPTACDATLSTDAPAQEKPPYSPMRSKRPVDATIDGYAAKFSRHSSKLWLSFVVIFCHILPS